MGMFIIIILIGAVILVFYNNKIKIKWRTFTKKGIKVKKGNFGVYCFCGKQGRGKTYSIVEFLKNEVPKGTKIYSNIESIKGIDYTYFSGFEELLKLRYEEDVVIVYDEIFTALTKGSKMTTDVLAFLSQMRKQHIVFLTSAQEWLEINITLRRYCRYQIECNIITLGNCSFLIKRFYDAEQMKWDNLENEYVAPIISTTISKMNKSTAKSYDTYEVIKS